MRFLRCFVVAIRSLLPGILGVALIFDRFPHIGAINYLECSHYLGPLQRILDGMELVKDVQFIFGPALFWILAPWMRHFGASYAHLPYFFYIGWYLYLILLGIMCAQSLRHLSLALLALAVFAVFALPLPSMLKIWGGPRYLPGVLVLAVIILALKTKSKNGALTLSILAGVLGCLGLFLAPEQIVIALATLILAAIFDRALLGSFAVRTVMVYQTLAMSLAFSSLIFIVYLYSIKASDLALQYITDLPYYSALSQPLTLSLQVYMACSAFFLVAFGLLSDRSWMISANHDGVAERARTLSRFIVIAFGILSFVYSLRGSNVIQATVGLGFLFLALLNILELVNERHCRKITVLYICAALALLILGMTSLNPLDRASMKAEQIADNVAGRPFYCLKDCRPVDSKIVRLEGAIVPDWQAQDLEGVYSVLEPKLRAGADFFIFPEQGFLEYVLEKSAISRFPVVGLAHTRAIWARQILDTLSTRRPEYVVRANYLSFLAQVKYFKSELLPDVGAYIEQHYKIIERTPAFDIMIRKDITYVP